MFKIRLFQMIAITILGLVSVGGVSSQDRTLSVDSHRALDAAVDQLHARYGWVITYQDPPYEYPDDLVNITPPGTMVDGILARKHMVPRKRSVTVAYSEPKTGSPEDKHKTLDEIVKGFREAGAGEFRIHHRGPVSHIVPKTVRRASGGWEQVSSLCDIEVSFPPAMRTIHESVMLILSQVSQRMGTHIFAGLMPWNRMLNGVYMTGAQNENACDALVEVLESVNFRRAEMHAPMIHGTWAMLYDPTIKQYAFNVSFIEAPKPPSPLLGRPPGENIK